MPRLSPFVGLVFDPSRVGPFERVTAPPYDAISPEERTRLQRASEANIVRLILPRPDASQAGPNALLDQSPHRRHATVAGVAVQDDRK